MVCLLIGIRIFIHPNFFRHNYLPTLVKILNMGLIIRICMTGIVVFLLAQILPGVSVADYFTAILVAVILALLNFIVKPVLVLLTLPITVLTLGLFLLVVNAIIILLADALMGGFEVSGFWIALLFSLLLSLFQSILFSFLDKD